MLSILIFITVLVFCTCPFLIFFYPCHFSNIIISYYPPPISILIFCHGTPTSVAPQHVISKISMLSLSMLHYHKLHILKTMLYVLLISMTELIDIGAMPTVKGYGAKAVVSAIFHIFLQVLTLQLIYNLTISTTSSETIVLLVYIYVVLLVTSKRHIFYSLLYLFLNKSISYTPL